MFFILSKILAPFLYPLTHVFLLLLFALVCHRKPRIVKISLTLAILLLMIFATYPVPDIMLRFLENRYQTASELPRADAVVVLTGMVNLKLSTPEYVEFNDSVERILTGIRLVKKEYGERLIIVGGSGNLHNQTKSEARILRAFAIDFDIAEEKILIEPDSRNTYENALKAKTLLEKYEISDFILVTSASHLPRSMWCFEKLGMNPIPYRVDPSIPPTPRYRLSDIIPSVGALRKTSRALHEYVGILIYKLAGYI